MVVSVQWISNGKILENSNFKNIWIPPPPSDAGSTIGFFPLHLYHVRNGEYRPDNKTPYLGPHYTNDDVENVLEEMECLMFGMRKGNIQKLFQ